MPNGKKMAELVIQQNFVHKDNTQFIAAKKGWWKMVISNIVIIIIYFILSIGLTFYQRWLLVKFHFPLSIVVCHLLIKFSSSVVYRSIWQCAYHRRRITLNWRDNFYKISPTGLVSGLDVGFSNWGIELITISLYTMTKSTTIVFILGFALLFKLEKKSWGVVMIVVMIAGGLGMFTYKATQFNTLGFLLVLFASFMSGLRWTLTQFIMQRSELGLRHPIDMLYHIQPWMMLSVLPIAIAFEGGSVVSAFHSIMMDQNWTVIIHITFFVILGAFVALAMELSEYLVVSRTSSLTLSVAGIFKEICTLVLAVEWNGDQMTKLNVEGLFLCLGGIICHVVHKALSSTKESNTAVSKPLLDEASAHFLAEDTSSDEDNPHDDSSTEILFSVLNSRDRYLSSLEWSQTDANIEPMYFNELTPSLRR